MFGAIIKNRLLDPILQDISLKFVIEAFRRVGKRLTCADSEENRTNVCKRNRLEGRERHAHAHTKEQKESTPYFCWLSGDATI